MTTSFTVQEIQSQIKTLPNHPLFMITQDIAPIYDTQPRNINQAVKRNPKRFPSDFCFQLTTEEFNILRSQSVIAKYSKTRTNPYAFTREGVNMLSTVLHTEIAIERSIQIMRAFSAMETGHFHVDSSETIKNLVKNQEKMLEQFQNMACQITTLSQDFSRITERMSILENRVDAVMNVRNTFNEKHGLFGKFVEVIAEEIDFNRKEISSIKEALESKPSAKNEIKRLINEQKKEDEFVNEKQVQLLKERVKAKKNSRKVWFLFRQHFGIASYSFLPKNLFRKALDWLETH